MFKPSYVTLRPPRNDELTLGQRCLRRERIRSSCSVGNSFFHPAVKARSSSKLVGMIFTISIASMSVRLTSFMSFLLRSFASLAESFENFVT